MLGLLYKDFYTAKKELADRLYGVGICGAQSRDWPRGDAGAFHWGAGFGGEPVPTYSIHYDKVNGWNKFVCASPYRRAKVVLSK